MSPLDWIGGALAYGAIGLFLVAVIARAMGWAALPLHLRWELYPVAHGGDKARTGGSYLEESDWWTRPRSRSRWGEIRAMAPEILFLSAVFTHNRKLWWRTFPFHFGLYLIAVTSALMAVSGWIGLGPLGRLVPVLGLAGLGLGILGAGGLIARRLGDRALREFSAPSDFINLLFFVLALGCSLLSLLLYDRDLAGLTAAVADLATLRPVRLPGEGPARWLAFCSLASMSLLLAYVPLTHMSHFVAKYFAYHAVRWNDVPNLRGGPQEAEIRRLLDQPVSWAAAHVGADGVKSWAEIAGAPCPEEKKP